MPLSIPAPKQRALLAMLAVQAPALISTDLLVDQLWDAKPPQTATSTVQVYVSQLRKLLGAKVIQTRPPGYVLAPDVRVDAVEFESLAAEGRGVLEAGDPADALQRWGVRLRCGAEMRWLSSRTTSGRRRLCAGSRSSDWWRSRIALTRSFRWAAAVS